MMPEGGSRGRGMRRRTIVAVALLAILVLFVGGLVIYSAGVLSRFKRVEARIERGPQRQPANLELVINTKTAKALGRTIPPSLLQRADQVIE